MPDTPEKSQERSLVGTVAIVTGAGQGIGASEARGLARAGAHVVVNDVGRVADDPTAYSADRVVAEILAEGGSAEANHSDITTPEGGQELVDQAIAVNGALDTLVCNAGIVRDRTIVKMTAQEWDAVIKVHLHGHFHPIHVAAQHWRERARATGEPVRASIVTTSSEAGLFGNFGQPNYSAAKAGIIALTQVAARELASSGVTANSICPRARTPMTEGVVPGIEPVPGEVDDWDPEGIVPWIVFLAGPQAREISGEMFVVYGNTVRRMAPWAPVAEIKRDTHWDQESLAKAVLELGGGSSRMVLPEFLELRDRVL
ncbi:SDR family NAD(P)-dependent oxidoreductase [Pseudonocardia sp. NPDC049154]|uniref:SDR family NAD(P)-dependent oxidoreductase n=1 Tax=Pseudonocardia sp. NPDC049154 TaxID=3155501 RepID=UPI0033E05C2E